MDEPDQLLTERPFLKFCFLKKKIEKCSTNLPDEVNTSQLTWKRASLKGPTLIASFSKNFTLH